MELCYTAERDVDQFAREVQAQQPTAPMRLRVQPTLLYNYGTKRLHRTWTGVSWTIACRDADEVILIRHALGLFFRSLVARGPAAVEAALSALMELEPTP